MSSSFPSDFEIANAVEPRPIADVAAELDLEAADLDLYGHSKAKLKTPVLESLETPGKLVIVTTPTGRSKRSAMRSGRSNGTTPRCGSSMGPSAASRVTTSCLLKHPRA